jgi:hypothetical protein
MNFLGIVGQAVQARPLITDEPSKSHKRIERTPSSTLASLWGLRSGSSLLAVEVSAGAIVGDALEASTETPSATEGPTSCIGWTRSVGAQVGGALLLEDVESEGVCVCFEVR